MTRICYAAPVFSAVGGIDFSGVCAALLLCAALIVILKNFGFKGAPVFAALVATLSLSYAAKSFGEINEAFLFIGSFADISDYVKTALKIIGISYLSGISSDVCREIGEGGIAKCISIVTKLELIAISLPYIAEMMESLFTLAEA